ncbi:MAG TPA: hypothetical protein PKD12_17925 [Nitrospira sp.]|nr:hypothetical protein [Nitrospira sp.]
MVRLHHLELAFIRFQLDRLEFFRGGHSLTGYHIGQFDSLEPVLIELVEVDGEIEDPHEHVPLTPDCPRGRLRSKSGRDVGETILSCEGVQGTLAKAGE